MVFTKQAKEYNTFEDAEIASNDIHNWAIENVDGYNANSWGEPYLYEGKYYIFVDERIINCPIVLGFLDYEFTIINEEV